MRVTACGAMGKGNKAFQRRRGLAEAVLKFN